MESALHAYNMKDTESWARNVQFHPGRVRNVSCFSVSFSSDDGGSDEIGLELSWQPPWNLPYMPMEISGRGSTDANVQYEIVIQEQGEGELYSGAFILSATKHVFREGFRKGHVYYCLGEM